MSSENFSIGARFNGPPDSGNGGYVCGEMAKALSRRNAATESSPGAPPLLESGVRVRLMKPPPLETELRFDAMDDGSLGLFSGKDLLAQAWADPVAFDVPPAIDLAAAQVAEKKFRGFEEHIFPNCFVCGPDRGVGDGLRIFPGPSDAKEHIFAATWQTDSSLAVEDGSEIDSSFIWAALDCPGCFSFPQPEGAIVLLGEFSAAIHSPIATGETTTLLSWQIEHSGRKHTTGSAIYDAQGRCCGQARGIWIELPR